MQDLSFSDAELTVIAQGEELVVDSRLIAAQLELQHESVIKTIKKYSANMQALGNLRFEIGTSVNSVGARHQVTFCYLNEKQCNMLIGLSKNTHLVVNALQALVVAFDKAKEAIKSNAFAKPDSEALRTLELQDSILARKERLARQADTMITIYGTELGLTLLGHSGQTVEVEKLVTEVVNPATNNADRILTADQLKKVVKQKTGQNLKTAKQFADALVKAGRDDLLLAVTRNQTGLYPDADRIDEALEVVYGSSRQRLISPVPEERKRLDRRPPEARIGRGAELYERGHY
jgi:phage regulator Rha-like protein